MGPLSNLWDTNPSRVDLRDIAIRSARYTETVERNFVPHVLSDTCEQCVYPGLIRGLAAGREGGVRALDSAGRRVVAVRWMTGRGAVGTPTRDEAPARRSLESRGTAGAGPRPGARPVGKGGPRGPATSSRGGWSGFRCGRVAQLAAGRGGIACSLSDLGNRQGHPYGPRSAKSSHGRPLPFSWAEITWRGLCRGRHGHPQRG